MKIQNPILFHGSRERLQRIVARSNGDWLPDRQFRIKMRDSSLKLPVLTFSFRCRWEPADNGIRIIYAVLPTIPTLLLFLLALILVTFPDFCPKAPIESCIIPGLFLFGYMAQMLRCVDAFQELFSTPTS